MWDRDIMNLDLKRKLMDGGKKGEKRFPCNYCDRMFTSSQALGGHQNGHRIERETTRKAQEEAHLLAMQMPPPFPSARCPSFRPMNHHILLQHGHQNHAQSLSRLANRSIPRLPYCQPHRSLNCAHDGMRPRHHARFASPYPFTIPYARGMARDEDPRFSARNSTTVITTNVGGVTRGGDPRLGFPPPRLGYPYTTPHVGGMARNEEQPVFMNSGRNYNVNNGGSHVLAERAQVNMTGPLTSMIVNHVNRGEVSDIKNATEKEIDLTLRL
ncbi:uncharacterized protein [Typha angustifolia]|uniref:uncharacterized protein n=1 Tax=Typha angustifolia TaxID=59011 RepID=UPI003C2E8B4B